MSSGGRGIIVRIWNNFLSSITTKQSPHREVGRDHFGNKYFEIAADPSRGKRKPRRWFEPRIKDNFSADMPPEWEAWLRARRAFPPTQEWQHPGLTINATKYAPYLTYQHLVHNIFYSQHRRASVDTATLP
ncbi:NADH dehydrogenase [ubiquinone] 1 alpha subcomplex assembly factor 2 isoform X2 [Dermacentor andersoni]|uniref:NADH dehydrogenase [ubiquinone] 1 alpha subcomplex assembly factor 2 isoform X2 n=1 Tax=Dermacentor andersoni TaxID=34620 RepID=UPI00241627DB|nr:NADH dehydrogenase [ubiquinone] 1 alpha subcomplex assembly factor 2-like isoform X2 [Dermacentor andersoni]XP_054931543.1 NADH dehydrogenase [ubiquinone] 1 alpha subcomplex assembly factor 2-like isoform X2 [Dermacentor andersoni]